AAGDRQRRAGDRGDLRAEAAAGVRRHRRGDESGFTLIELLVTVVIMALIVGPMAAAIVLGFRTTDDTATRLAGSHDAQLLATYLVPDVQSVGTSADADTSASGDPGCS